MDWALEGIAAALLASLVLLQFVQGIARRPRKRKYRLPPGPPAWPILGHLPLLATSRTAPHETTSDLAKLYGPVILLKLGACNVVFVSHPRVAEECLKSKDAIFGNRAVTSLFRYSNYGTQHMSVAPLGEYWRSIKKLCTTQMLNGTKIQQFQSKRAEVVGESLHYLYQESKEKAVVDLRELLMKQTMNNITEMLMGKRFCSVSAAAEPTSTTEQLSDAAEWVQAIETGFQLFGLSMIEDFFPALAWIDRLTGNRLRMQNYFAHMDKLLQDIVDSRRKELALVDCRPEAETFLDVMLSMNKEDANSVSDTSIKAIMLETINAGTETSSMSVEWALSELLANPDIMSKAQAEVDKVVGKDRLVTEADVEKMPYLRAIVKETFRLHNPGPYMIPHATFEDTQIEGYDIPANTILMVQVWAMGRDPAFWDHQPSKFYPERFVGNSNNQLELQVMQMVPTGMGRRKCPGANLGMTLVHYALARYIHSFDFSLPHCKEQVDMAEKFGMTLPRQNHLEVLVEPRLPTHLY